MKSDQLTFKYVTTVESNAYFFCHQEPKLFTSFFEFCLSHFFAHSVTIIKAKPMSLYIKATASLFKCSAILYLC